VPDIALLMEVAFYEALHVGLAVGAGVSAKNLEVDGGKVMIGIGLQLRLKLSQRLRFDRIAFGVGIGVRASIVNSADTWQRSQHVVEGTVFHHQHDDVLQIIESGWHDEHSAMMNSAAGAEKRFRERRFVGRKLFKSFN
jgi:hypothetical protein